MRKVKTIEKIYLVPPEISKLVALLPNQDPQTGLINGYIFRCISENASIDNRQLNKKATQYFKDMFAFPKQVKIKEEAYDVKEITFDGEGEI